MLTIEPTGEILGATVRGVDLSQPLSEPDFGRILLALGSHGVLRFPDQHLESCPTVPMSSHRSPVDGASRSRVRAWRNRHHECECHLLQAGAA